MSEHQNIEYKQSWHDENLKWIVGFANSQGGIGKNRILYKNPFHDASGD